MKIHGCYRFNRQYLAIELTLPCTPDEIDWFGFSVPEENVGEFDRAVPHMEQYFSPDGKIKLCEAWEEPDQQEAPTRVVFFLRQTAGQYLDTPFGPVSLEDPQPLPPHLRELLEFEKE